MRKIYNKFYRISGEEKISDRVMTCRLISMVLVVILCVAVMSFAAYSYFECDVSSKDNHVEAATFKIKTEITYTDESNPSPTSIVPVQEDSSYSVQIEKSKTYTIKIRKTTDSTAETGFCVVKVDGDSIPYHTLQLGANGNNVVSEITFTVRNVSAENDKVKVTFSPHWGTSTYYSEYQSGASNDHYITDNKEISIN